MKITIKTAVIGIAKLGVMVLLFVLALNTNRAQAQTTYYGGSAYVHVKNSKGETRTLNETWPCKKSDASEVRIALENALKYKKKNDEEYDSVIFYSIDNCNTGNGGYYGGSASVKVRDKDGQTRTLNETWPCKKSDASEVRIALENALKYKKKTDEEYVSGISYHIESCK